ncbi:MAG: DUF11 domain-containing protein, partial [Adlercreutzia sp.]|nr:DUF11 domain-containing protein [Adlercreutzia sp.]
MPAPDDSAGTADGTDGASGAPAPGEPDDASYGGSQSPESNADPDAASTAGGVPARSDANAGAADPKVGASSSAAAALAAAIVEHLSALPLAAAPRATAGPFSVTGGTVGAAAGQGDCYYDGTVGVLHIQTSAELTISTPVQTNSTIAIDSGVKANLVFAGVDIRTSKGSPVDVTTNLRGTADGSRATEGTQILPEKRTSLYLKVADNSENKLWTDFENGAGIHCGEGSDLVIDDILDNRDASGKMAEIVGAKVAADITLSSGKTVRAGEPSTALDSANPGKLTVTGGNHGAGIGSTAQENGGTITVNGGDLKVDAQNAYVDYDILTGGFSAGIGAGSMGDGTATAITINGGNIDAHGGAHGAGIGAALSLEGFTVAVSGDVIPSRHKTRSSNVAGNIYINGGFVKATGGFHGGAFGSACFSTNKDHVIIVTGGTLLPTAGSAGACENSFWLPFPEIGGRDGYVVITGGSVRCTDPKQYFQGIGNTAWGSTDYSDNANKVEMVTIDLGAELRANNKLAGLPEDTPLDNAIEKWDLYVAGVHYNYGAPTRFDDGKLYLWLPKAVVDNDQISVSLSYQDAKGEIQEVLPLFREPGQADTLLKRYLAFDITDTTYLSSLTKPYDGLPLPSYDLEKSPVTTPAPDSKLLNRNTDGEGNRLVTYLYQPFDHVPVSNEDEPAAMGPETSEIVTAPDGSEMTVMPADVGAYKYTIVSKQYADENSSDPEIAEFSKSYWGHKATGWCEIMPVASKVTSVTAAWADGSDIANPQDPAKTIDVSVDVTSGDGTAATCKAPTGKVQLYVDGEPAGDPVAIDLGAGGNATVRADADGREHTVVSWSFPAGELMSPGARHRISARYIPAINYLESADPAEEEVPESEVAVRPDPKIAPEPAVSKAVENLTHPQGPTQPGDRLRYTVTASNTAAGSLWTDVVLTDALPKCLELDASTLHLENAWEGVSGAPAAGDGKTEGTWALSAPGADGRRTLSVGADAVAGGSSAVLTFECTVGEPDFASASGDDLDLANVAEATGTRPDPADPDSPMPDPDDPDRPLPVAPSPTGPV